MINLDKKLKILKCLKFPAYTSLGEIQNMSGIKNMDVFNDCIDDLGIDQYIRPNPDNNMEVTLYFLSSRKRYIKKLRSERIKFILVVVGTVSAIASAIFGLIQLITIFSSVP